MSFRGRPAVNHPGQLRARGTPSLFVLPADADGHDDVDDRGTPADVFDPLNAEFAFTLDVCASPHNAKCARYFTRDDDGLTRSWAGERVWCNPPFSGIEEWVRKARRTRAPLVVMLLPNNRCEQPWWQTWIEPVRDRPGSRLHTRFLPGRPRFHPRLGPSDRPPFGVVLLIWRRHV